MEHNSAFSKDQANVGNAYAKNKGKLKGNLLHMPRDQFEHERVESHQAANNK